ncbi:hypothetical protein ACFL1X_02230 [Candidatus Hydrogenedentota bacterium]
MPSPSKNRQREMRFLRKKKRVREKLERRRRLRHFTIVGAVCAVLGGLLFPFMFKPDELGYLDEEAYALMVEAPVKIFTWMAVGVSLGIVGIIIYQLFIAQHSLRRTFRNVGLRIMVGVLICSSISLAVGALTWRGTLLNRAMNTVMETPHMEQTHNAYEWVAAQNDEKCADFIQNLCGSNSPVERINAATILILRRDPEGIGIFIEAFQVLDDTAIQAKDYSYVFKEFQYLITPVIIRSGDFGEEKDLYMSKRATGLNDLDRQKRSSLARVWRERYNELQDRLVWSEVKGRFIEASH